MGKMTKLPGVPEKETAVPGMAYFAGTGPADKTCGQCAHLGPWGKRDGYRCRMFHKLTGHYGPRVGRWNEACKYFEAD